MSNLAAQPRRRFFKAFALGAAVSFLGGRSWKNPFLAEAVAAAPGAGLLTLKLSEFSALQSANGSVRLSLNPFSSFGASGPYYPILVNRGTGSQFFALQARCNHSGGVVAPFAGGACVCQFHFSRFGIDGSLQLGPATQGLAQYPISFDGSDKLVVELPSLGYSVAVSPVQASPGPRLRLDFPTQSGLAYEIRHRQNISDAGTLVQFAASQDGPANQSSIAGTGATLSAYVDRAANAGFYTVNVRVTPG